MAFITQEEIVRVARMANIALKDDEIIKMQSHVEAVLAYAARVQDIVNDSDISVLKARSVERDDSIIEPNPEPILSQAPEREGNFFVVPAIIETTE